MSPHNPAFSRHQPHFRRLSGSSLTVRRVFVVLQTHVFVHLLRIVNCHKQIIINKLSKKSCSEFRKKKR